jgi:hypothetical protein
MTDKLEQMLDSFSQHLLLPQLQHRQLLLLQQRQEAAKCHLQYCCSLLCRCQQLHAVLHEVSTELLVHCATCELCAQQACLFGPPVLQAVSFFHVLPLLQLLPLPSCGRCCHAPDSCQVPAAHAAGAASTATAAQHAAAAASVA